VDNYPEHCLRGLRNEEDVTPEGYVNSPAFYPDFRESKRRADGGYETSINWEDDAFAIAFTLKRIEQSQYGIAILQRGVIDAEATSARILGIVTYERKPESDNKYHGNIIYSGKASRQLIKMLAAVFARRARLIPR
jgi:hypothetical protein